jgi:hypothetical protein
MKACAGDAAKKPNTSTAITEAQHQHCITDVSTRYEFDPFYDTLMPTDSQMADALHQFLPPLSDPDYLQASSLRRKGTKTTAWSSLL